MTVPLFFLASLLVSTCHGGDYQIYPLRLKTGSAGEYIEGVTCRSWQLGVEAHNLIGWSTVPRECEGYVGNYMLGDQYRLDSKYVCREAYFYARRLNLTGDGKDIWIFDVDETAVSSLPYYAQQGFGAEPYNSTGWNEWVMRGVAPTLPESKKLYDKLLSLGFKIVFLTGRDEDQWNVTATNLKNAGYHTFETLIVRDSYFANKTAVAFKSAQRRKLVNQGYRIIGNIGDQWSDLLGTYPGKRSFKLPDPMYYLS